MSLPETVAEKLAKPLDPARVHKREGGGGRQLSYLEAHDVIRTANEIFGVGQWGYEVRQLDHLGTEIAQGRDNKQGHRVAYRAVVQVSFNGGGFSDVGYGDAVEYGQSALTPHELAAKEAVSDAVKRCLKNYGDQFGLCLYSKDAPEHRGVNGSAGTSSGVPSPSPSPAPSRPAGTDGEFRFASGKYEGKTLAEVPDSYLQWYSANGPKQDVKDAIAAFRGGVVPSPADPYQDDIPFEKSGGF